MSYSGRKEIKTLVELQLYTLFNWKLNVAPYLDEAIKRTERILQVKDGKYFQNGDISIYNTIQYCIFLYWLSRVMWEMDGNGDNAEKVYNLNKALNCVELFYEVRLPDIWMCEHPLGSVMGRAIYSDRFVFYQGCTVGVNHGEHPVLGTDVIMYPNSVILGKCNIGNHVIFSANSYVKDMDIPDNCIIFGQYPNVVIKQKTREQIERLTGHIWRYNDDVC